MSLPSLRRRLIMALGGAGVVLLILLSGLMLVAEDKMEELSLRHWLEAEVTRYSDDWLRLGPAAAAPSTSWARRTNTFWWPVTPPARDFSTWCSMTTLTTTSTPTKTSCI